MLIRCRTVSIETDNKEKLNVLNAHEELRMWSTLIGLVACTSRGAIIAALLCKHAGWGRTATTSFQLDVKNFLSHRHVKKRTGRKHDGQTGSRKTPTLEHS